MGIIFQDAFAGTDGDAITARTPDTGDHYTQDILQGSAIIEIASNEMVADSNRNNSSNLITARIAAGETDYSSNLYDVEMKMPGIDTSGIDNPFAIGGRYTDTNNYYTATVYSNNNSANMRIIKKVAGTFTELASGDFDLSLDDIIKLELRDATKKLFQGASERLSTTDNALTGNGVACFVWGVACTGTAGDDVAINWNLDDFKVTEVAANPTIDTITPSSGSESGGTSVVIAGANYEAVQGTGGVTVGGVAATIDSWADTSITITTPAGTIGKVDVVVTNDSAGTVTETDGYEYTADSTSLKRDLESPFRNPMRNPFRRKFGR